MPEIDGKVIAHIMNEIDKVRANSTAQYVASLTLNLATMRALIEKGDLTVDEACNRITSIQNALPDLADRKSVDFWLQWAIDILQGRTPIHGSIIDQQIQRKQRSEL